jgi:hypothetical protein
MQSAPHASAQDPQAHSASAANVGLERQSGDGAATQRAHAGSDTQAPASEAHWENAHSWHAGFTPTPASRGGGALAHCPEVHAHGDPPQEPPRGPVDEPGQQRPPHQPQVERAVHAAQSLALTHSSVGAPASMGPGAPASGADAPTQATKAAYRASHPTNGNGAPSLHAGAAARAHS